MGVMAVRRAPMATEVMAVKAVTVRQQQQVQQQQELTERLEVPVETVVPVA